MMMLIICEAIAFYCYIGVWGEGILVHLQLIYSVTPKIFKHSVPKSTDLTRMIYIYM